MRAQFIYEKFTQDSDPISDLHIGIGTLFDKWKSENISRPYNNLDQDVLDCIEFCNTKEKYDFIKYLLDKGADIHYNKGSENQYTELPLRYAIWYNDLKMTKLLIKRGANIKKSLSANEIQELKNGIPWNSILHRVDKKLLDYLKSQINKKSKKTVNEKFTQDSDPIHDMGIGVQQLVDEFKKDLYNEAPFLELEDVFEYFPNEKTIDIDCWPLSKSGYDDLIKAVEKVIKKYENVLEITFIPDYEYMEDEPSPFLKIMVK